MPYLSTHGSKCRLLSLAGSPVEQALLHCCRRDSEGSEPQLLRGAGVLSAKDALCQQQLSSPTPLLSNASSHVISFEIRFGTIMLSMLFH